MVSLPQWDVLVEARPSFELKEKLGKAQGGCVVCGVVFFFFLICTTTGVVSEAFRELRDVYIRGDKLKDKQ